MPGLYRSVRRGGGGEAVAHDPPLAIGGFVEHEQLLIGFGDFLTRGVDRGRAGGVGSCKRPVIGDHFDVDDLELDVEVDSLEDGFVGGFDRVDANRRGLC